MSIIKILIKDGCLLCAALFFLLFSDVAIEAVSGQEVLLHPVDCVLSEWTAWSGCDVCQKKRYRHATLVQPAMFGGEPCFSHDKEEEACTPPARYTCEAIPHCEGFKCTITGRCIPTDLRCNGDDDCGDRSDEKDCVNVKPACKQKAEEYWGIENLAKGINVVDSSLQGTVLDNRYYAGSCLPQFIQDIRFRKPYNLQQYTMETGGTYDFTMNSFQSYEEYKSFSSKESSSKTSVTIGFALPGVAEFGFNYSDDKYSKSVRKIRRASGKKNSFVRAKSELQLARYALKDSDLMLHADFLKRLHALPQSYVYGEYRQIYLDYGTHYITEAVLGGDYEHTIILNKERLEKTDYTLDQYKTCVQVGIKAGLNVKGVYVTAGVDAGGCDGLLNEMGTDTVKGSMTEDFVAIVRGGTSETITALVAKKLPTPDLMRLWGEGVHYNPDFIRSTTKLLFELVTSRDFVNANNLKKNMRKALEEYLIETSSCRCSPCRNNGVAVLKGKRCDCVCPIGYSGRGCEITQRKGIAIDGGWSCWGSWTPCSGRTRTRTRQCNNPPPSSDGSSCWGLSEESFSC